MADQDPTTRAEAFHALKVAYHEMLVQARQLERSTWLLQRATDTYIRSHRLGLNDTAEISTPLSKLRRALRGLPGIEK